MKARRMFLIVLPGLLAAALSWSELTIDVGGTIRNATAVEAADAIGVAQGDRVTAWLRVNGPKSEFLLKGFYDLTYADKKLTHLADVERFSLVSTVPSDGKPLSRFELSLGRRPVVDQTGMVVAQALDGFGVATAYPFAEVSASVGSTFLPNKTNAPVVLSTADAADLGNDGVLAGSPRVVGLLEVVFPSVLRQRVTISLLMQEDLRGLLENAAISSAFPNRAGTIGEGTTSQDPSKGGLVDTQYSSLGVRGNIADGLFYDAFFTLGTGRTLSYVTEEGSATGSYQYTPILAGAGGAGLTLYAEKALGSVAGLRFVYSSGDGWDERGSLIEGSLEQVDADGKLLATPSLFIPVTGAAVSRVFAPTLGNLAFVEASYALRPFSSLGSALLEKLQVGVTALMFLRPYDGPISVKVTNTDSTRKYLGSEADFSVAFRPFSDFAVELTGGLFLPNNAENADPTLAGPFTGEPVRWSAGVSASLSF